MSFYDYLKYSTPNCRSASFITNEKTDLFHNNSRQSAIRGVRVSKSNQQEMMNHVVRHGIMCEKHYKIYIGE